VATSNFRRFRLELLIHTFLGVQGILPLNGERRQRDFQKIRPIAWNYVVNMIVKSVHRCRLSVDRRNQKIY